MPVEIALTALAALVVSIVLTGVTRRLALMHGALDVPNERSSHLVPTPRGGGVAIVIGTSLGLVMLAAFGVIDARSLAVLMIGGLAVAAIGFLDDRHQLSARVRLLVHVGAAAWAMFLLGGLPPLQMGEQVVDLGWIGHVLGTLAIVWSLNLFNFMDGIDGIAASEGAFVAFAGALIALMAGLSGALVGASLVIGAACCGFLAWNWPPAKIFMGDVGSGYVGYVLAVLGLLAARQMPVGWLIWLVLVGLFFVDATVTLVRRLARRERLYQAHRSHAYQWLARKWSSHRSVTLLTLALNVFWLLPLAVLVTLYPLRATWIAIGALIPVAIGVVAAGAGRQESKARRG